MTKKNAKSVLGPIGAFFRDFRRLISMGVGLAALPAVSDLVLFLGPPWPNRRATTLIAAMVCWTVLLWTFVNWRHAQEQKQRRILNRAVCLFFVALFFYVALKASFVYDAPDKEGQVAGGFLLRPESERQIEELKLTTGEILSSHLYNSRGVWVTWTVSLIEISVLAFWLLVFAMIAAIGSLFLVHQEALGSDEWASRK